MFTLEDLKYNKLLKKQFMAPFSKDDKRHGAAILLLSPNYETSKRLMTNPFMVDRMKVFSSYYIERDIMYSINQDNKFLETTYPDEGQGVFTETTDISMPMADLNDCEMNELFCRLGDKVMFFPEMAEDMYFDDLYGSYQMNEAKVASINMKYKQLLYHDRLRNNKEVIDLYKRVKMDLPWIRRTYPVFQKYRGFNLFVDLYYYNEMYLTNNNFSMLRSIDMYYEFILRILKDRRIADAGYKKLTVFIPIYGWPKNGASALYDYKMNLNPMSVIYKKMRLMPNDLKFMNGLNFVFIGHKGYFKFDVSKIPIDFQIKFKKFITTLESGVDFVEEGEDEIVKDSPAAITASLVDDIEVATGAKINNLTGNLPSVMSKTKEELEEDEKPLTRLEKKRREIAKASAEAIRDTQLASDISGKKAMLVSKIKKAAEKSTSKEDALEKLEEDEDVKRIIADLDSESDSGTVTISATRSARITQTQDQFMKKQFHGRTIKQMLSENKSKELPESSIPIATVNKEWHHMKATNFEKEYDLDADIVKCINSLADKNTKSYPIAILDIDKKDTSTSEDSIYTYTVSCEGYDGKRFSFKFDIPKFRNNRFMRLRGNEKIFSIEMPLIPISKTDDNTAQMATFYNKIFIMRYNTSAGKSNPYTNKLLKALDKYKGSDIRCVNGDCYRISQKYELPIDYIDIGRVYTKIIYHSKNLGENVTIYLNQDEIRKIPGINPKNGIPVAMTESGKVVYYTNSAEVPIAIFIANLIDVPKFEELYAAQDLLKRSTYSRAKLLNTYIPVIVVLAHDIGLIKAMDMAGIEYEISTKRKIQRSGLYDIITFKDGFLSYKATYASMMLMNGLKDCDTETIKITDINKKATWIEQLANFGGRNKSDGLDNFRSLMYDPVTVEVCKDYKLPTTYHEGLIYASNLLVDNKFIKHTDLASNRYRTNEIVAAQLYRVLAQAYREYASFAKRNRKAALMMKQTAVIDLILEQNNTSDLSVFQPLSEIETKNTISTKGVTGLNSDRSYTLEKRGYDPSMQDIIAQSTSFAKQVGVNRQCTIDPNIMGGRGYFKRSDVQHGGVAQSMGMTESLSPFMLTSDDPYRNNMTFVQTAKHSTPVEDSDPLLVTTGADQAMPYLSSDMFAFKAKGDGKVTAITLDYMLVEYKDGKKDYINLSEQTMKNSDGGFYIVLQLITDLKVGSKFKKDQVLAWDKKSFSKKVGLGQLSYNVGHLAKIAIMTTEDGFEDSGVCSEWLAESMASDIVVQKPISLTAKTEILQIVKVGQKVKEGEPLLIFQNAFDEDDANTILKNLNIEDGDITTIGRTMVNSKVTGVVTDIKLYRTCELSEMSDSMRKLFSTKEAQVRKLKSIAATTIGDVQFDPTEKLEKQGKLKNSETDVLIELYVKYHDKCSIGDKMANLNANKIVLMNVYADEDAPYTDFRPTEKIDVVSSASSIDGRMITSPFKNGALNKLMIELQRRCCEIYGKPWKTLHEIHEYYRNK